MQLDDLKYTRSAMPSVAKLIPGSEEAREQVDRILASNTLHASDVLRRLLRFLADKTFSGEADDLKEYSVGLDALGKPSTYDPRTDSGVRLQASRLRQKLEEYYRNEGSHDPVVILLPRGRFKIAWHPKSSDTLPAAAVPLPPFAASLPEAAAPAPELRNLKKWRSFAIALTVVTLPLALFSIWSFSRTSRTLAATPATAGSTPELDAIWSPFLSSGHHLIIAFINPLFVRLQRKGSPDILYRTGGNNSWSDAMASPEFSVLKQSLANPLATPTFNMVERSNLVATFVLSQFLAPRRGEISLARADELSWKDFADNDVILFGPFTMDGGLSALPVQPALVVDKAGVHNLQPLAGEPAVYADPPDHSASDGDGLDLVSVLPGPLGRTTVVTFSSIHKWGVIGGVQALTDPAFARMVLDKLKDPSGKIPHYYQIVFRVKYRDGTLTSASYVTHRVLAMTQNSVEARSVQ